MKNDEHKPTGAGKSSFKLIDTAKFFSELDLQNGVTFLDVACGWGSYSLAASDIVGKEGQVYAVDLWEEGILNLRKEAVSKGSQNLEAFVSDVSQNIPIENDCVDVCLMATALHDFVGDQVDRGAMKEIVRVMKPERHKKLIPSYRPTASNKNIIQKLEHIIICRFLEERMKSY
jgi:ubiquinone/menaquinone biosynthesis C-methylase UbiE